MRRFDRKTRARTCAFVIASTLAGCSAGTNSVPVVQGYAATGATVAFTVHIPSTSPAARRPHYVSAGTKSATITVNVAGGATAPPTIVNCGAGVCQATVAVPAGSDTFTIKLFDGTNGAGNLLSQGTAVAQILPNVANVVNVTFDAVLDHVVVETTTPIIAAGTATRIGVNVVGYDAAGYQISGPGSWVDANGNPITVTLTSTDSVLAGRAATTQLASSTFSSSSGTTLNYNGGEVFSTSLAAAPSSTIPGGTTTALVTYIPTVTAYSTVGYVDDLAIGPDGALWIAESNGVLERKTASGASAAYPIGSQLLNVVSDGASKLYLNDNESTLVSFDVTTHATASFATASSMFSLAYIASLNKVAENLDNQVDLFDVATSTVVASQALNGFTDRSTPFGSVMYLADATSVGFERYDASTNTLSSAPALPASTRVPNAYDTSATGDIYTCSGPTLGFTKVLLYAAGGTAPLAAVRGTNCSTTGGATARADGTMLYPSTNNDAIVQISGTSIVRRIPLPSGVQILYVREDATGALWAADSSRTSVDKIDY